MNRNDVRTFIQGLTDKLNSLPSSPALSSYLSFMIVEAVSLYKTTFEYWNIFEYKDFLDKCFNAGIPVEDLPGSGNDIRELSNKRFSNSLSIRLRLMASRIRAETRQLSIKAKRLCDLKLNVKNTVPSEAYNCWRECVMTFGNLVKKDTKTRVEAEFEKIKEKYKNAKKEYAARVLSSEQTSTSKQTLSTVPTSSKQTLSSERTLTSANEYLTSKDYLLKDEEWENDCSLGTILSAVKY